MTNNAWVVPVPWALKLVAGLTTGGPQTGEGRSKTQRVERHRGEKPLSCSGPLPPRRGGSGREGDHERPIGLGAEGEAKAAAAADALDLPPVTPPATGGAGHKAHALMAEHRRRIGRHHADRRDALALQPRGNGAGLGGGIEHQPLGGCQPHGGLILRAHREVGE